MKQTISPLEFFKYLVWLDGRPLLGVIEPYRQQTFMDVLYNFDQQGNPVYNFALIGRAKKNWKSTDLILACLYKLLACHSPHGNDCYLIANDEDQAADDLTIAKKLISVNPILNSEVKINKKEIVRNDGEGSLEILPAGDALGMHGKTYLFCGFDEIHGYRNWDVFEGMAPDPTRHDSLQWVSSYDSLYNSAGNPLFDLKIIAKRGEDPRMYFQWYSADYCTDQNFQDKEPEQRANPSMVSWGNDEYLTQQRRRLPTHKFRRLHLNLPGMPDGTYFDAEKVLDATIEGRTVLKPNKEINYTAFCDMSGGSSDDATLAIAHYDLIKEKIILDLITSQTGLPPFNPRHAVKKFAKLLKKYNVYSVTGDRFAGRTFRQDFQDEGISYNLSELTCSQYYEAFEPILNSGECELLDQPKMLEQLLGLVVRGTKITHMSSEHDDQINSASAAMVTVYNNVSTPIGEIETFGELDTSGGLYGYSLTDGIF